MMRPLIVLATDSREPSGLGEHMITLGVSLRDQFDVVVAGHGDAGGLAFLRRAAAAGLRIKAIELDQLGKFQVWLRAHADLLHVHAGIGWEGHELVRAGKAAGVPVVRTEHLPYLLTSPVQQAEYGAMLQSVDRVIAVSRAVYDSFAVRHGTRHLALVQNGISPRATGVDRAQIRDGLGLLTQHQMVLTIARFTPQKNYAGLLAAVPAVLQAQPDARFIWAGGGPEFAAMADAVANSGLGDVVTLLGHRDDIGQLLAAADLFVLPSLFEGLPLVLLEAMAAGLPIVATSIGGAIEAIGEDHVFLAPPDNAAALAGVITKALGDPEAAQASAKAGQQRFETQFQAGRMARETAQIYAALLPATTSQVGSP